MEIYGSENGQRDDLEILKAAASHPDTMFGARSIERSEVIAWLAPPESGLSEEVSNIEADPSKWTHKVAGLAKNQRNSFRKKAEKRQKETDERAKWTVAKSSNHEIDFYANTDSEQSIIKHAETTANYANAGTLSLSQSPAEATPQQHFLVSQENVDPPRVGLPRPPQQMLPAPRKGKGRKNITPRRAPMHS